MVIEVNDNLKKEIVAFCDDELNYHINESDCADKYHYETLAQIALLFLLDEARMASSYAYEYGNKLIGHPEQIELQKEIHEVLDKYFIKRL